ncbi:class I SAM-dependent methyltransferase [Flavivirga eckloniae]|uniref:Class I SAM-dependent methyltransferase n=1 Tax=Flavivirga eckloniae TaxID=1803846 RepID=A0A2K9PN95_9FLAO|nr:class I SAM-dependent methyltransferase [Flavivirga eckloniae]
MDFEKVAKQLAHPVGSFGIEVALGMNHLNQFISKNTYDLLQLGDSDKVLEVGMGNGKFIKDILSYGDNISYTGIDISETMIVEAKKLNEKPIDSRRVDIIHASIEKMPFWEEQFNKVCTINTVYFWKAPLIALSEVYRILTEDGVFVLSFRPYIEGQSLDFSQYGFTEYKAEDIMALVNKTNFKIVDTINITEPPVVFNGQTHNLMSQYYILRKTR